MIRRYVLSALIAAALLSACIPFPDRKATSLEDGAASAAGAFFMDALSPLFIEDINRSLDGGADGLEVTPKGISSLSIALSGYGCSDSEGLIELHFIEGRDAMAYRMEGNVTANGLELSINVEGMTEDLSIVTGGTISAIIGEGALLAPQSGTIGCGDMASEAQSIIPAGSFSLPANTLSEAVQLVRDAFALFPFIPDDGETRQDGPLAALLTASESGWELHAAENGIEVIMSSSRREARIMHSRTEAIIGAHTLLEGLSIPPGEDEYMEAMISDSLSFLWSYSMLIDIRNCINGMQMEDIAVSTASLEDSSAAITITLHSYCGASGVIEMEMEGESDGLSFTAMRYGMESERLSFDDGMDITLIGAEGTLGSGLMLRMIGDELYAQVDASSTISQPESGSAVSGRHTIIFPSSSPR